MRNKCICIHKPYDISITIELQKIPPPLKNRLKKHTKKHTQKNKTNTKHYTFVIPMHGSLIYNAVLTYRALQMSHMIKYILNCILDQIGKCHDGYEAQSLLYEYKKAKHAV